MSKLHALLFSLLLTFLLLTGCATLPSKPHPISALPTHPLSNGPNWKIKAAIAIRQPQQAWSAYLQWQQQQQYYHIVLFGPLGTHSFELTGQPGYVQLASADGRTSYAANPEMLLQAQTGLTIPVSSLYYWIRGLPVPGVPAEKQVDSYKHIVVLKQEGWTIQYLRYTSVNHVDLPTKIFLSNMNMSVKLIINEWQLFSDREPNSFASN